MRFIIKNITGDPLHPNPELRVPRTIYATSEALSNTMPIAAGEIRSIGEKAYGELTKYQAEYIEVIDSDGSPDIWAPFRKNVVLEPGVWTFVDLGRVTNYLEGYNDGPAQVKWSCSGFTAPDTEPPADFISDVDPGEMLSFYQTLDPVRYFYFMAVDEVATLKLFVA